MSSGRLDKNIGITRASLPGDPCGRGSEGYRWVRLSGDQAQQVASARELLEKRGRPVVWHVVC